MTHHEQWLKNWRELVDFPETSHRRTSWFIPEEHNLHSWWKHSKKLMNVGEKKEDGVAQFE